MPGDMARGTARSPSQSAYKGSVGQTQTKTVHITNARGDLIATTVHTTVDALSHPELVDRLYAGTLNTIRLDGQSAHDVGVPIVYHDPAAEAFVLVLGDAHRHREIEERMSLLKRLREDEAPIPAYVKDFGVVFDGKGLRAFLEQKAQQVMAIRGGADSKDFEKKK